MTGLPLSEPGGELLAAMAYLAALAYPESIAHRDRAVQAMLALMRQAARRTGRNVEPQGMRNQQINGTLGRMAERIGKRLDAAEAAAKFSLGARRAGPRFRIHPADVKRTRDTLLRQGASLAQADKLAATHRTAPGALLSVNETARRAARAGTGDWQRDTWRNSRPVLHLALALRGIGLQWTDPRGFTLFALLANPRWVRDALPSAEQWITLLERAEHPALASTRPRVRLLPE